MWWSALLPRNDDAAWPTDAALRALAIWALQFTPRVAFADEAVVMEVAASARLFGGQQALCERMQREGHEVGVGRLAWAPNSLAALALARTGQTMGMQSSLAAVLDVLPLESLSAVRLHRRALARMGCRTLGDMRRLPRSGLARRFDQSLLHALDRAYGRAPEVHQWVVLPERFEQRLELMHRVDDALAMMAGANRLLRVLNGWLGARHSGVTAFTLRWLHDTMRARAVSESGSITVRTAEATRDMVHLGRLLAEHLALVKLPAPVSDLILQADEVHPLPEQSASLVPDVVHEGQALYQVLERLSARLGPQRVLRPVLCEDHRPEWMCRWQPAAMPLPQTPMATSRLPQPTFLLPRPLKLGMRGERPVYEGELQLLLGPHRVEGGWWDRDESAGETRNVMRDYWVALSPQAGVLWVFQTRLNAVPAWYLHGHFA